MNKLSTESSPYLLQHANNPVDWHPWGQQAFDLAKEKDLPVLVSIGYSSCHWCHVMEHESFSNEATAQLMNELFINIKVDREERPDIDAIYMDAVQAMTGSGGWPLNVFLTADKKPFYGGTYFPPKPMYNRASWQEVLINIHQFYTHKKEELQLQTNQLLQHLQQAAIMPNQIFAENLIDNNIATEIRNNALKNADSLNGGFGNAPKFPNCSALLLLLNDYLHTQNQSSLNHVCLTLDKLYQGGIWDHIGGGFARYSTDAFWKVPHFEKMLYDNAQLIEVYALAFHITKNQLYKDIVTAIYQYLTTEMMDEDTSFYAAQDADSEGLEGKYYLFSFAEITNLLKENATIFCQYFNIKENGNLQEHHGEWAFEKNILHTTIGIEKFCELHSLNVTETKIIIQNCLDTLLQYRSQRIPPFKDKKVIFSWNALLAKAFINVSFYLQDSCYASLAEKNIKSLQGLFITDSIHNMKRVCLNGKANQLALLEDYAYYCEALIYLYQSTANTHYAILAKEILDAIHLHFSLPNTCFFSNSHQQLKDVILQKVETQEHSMPNPNAIIRNCLEYLGILFNDNNYLDRAQLMLDAITSTSIKHPNYYSNWCIALQNKILNSYELTIASSTANLDIIEFYKNYKHGVKIFPTTSASEIPYLTDKYTHGHNKYFLCHNNTCFSPFSSWEQLIEQGFITK